MNELAAEIAALPSNTLDFEFDGQGVYGRTITFRRLESLIQPVGGTVRWTARDIARHDGLEMSGTVLTNLVEPVLTEVYEGSFGIRVARSPVAEQGNLFEASLFDRTAERIMSVFRIARDTGDTSAVLQSVLDLRSNSIKAFRNLASQIAGSGTTHIRWQGEEVIAVAPSTAAVLVDALSNIEVEEETITVVGRLEGGDIADERFHIVTTDADTGRERHYRGDVEPDVLGLLRQITLGSQVSATLTEATTYSDYFARPRVAHTLTDIRQNRQESA